MAGYFRFHALLLATALTAVPMGEAGAQMPRRALRLPSVEVNLEVLRSLQQGGPMPSDTAEYDRGYDSAAAPSAADAYGYGAEGGYTTPPPPVATVPVQPPPAPRDPNFVWQNNPQGGMVPQQTPPAMPDWAAQRMEQAQSQMQGGLVAGQGNISTYQPNPPPANLPQELPAATPPAVTPAPAPVSPAVPAPSAPATPPPVVPVPPTATPVGPPPALPDPAIAVPVPSAPATPPATDPLAQSLQTMDNQLAQQGQTPPAPVTPAVPPAPAPALDPAPAAPAPNEPVVPMPQPEPSPTAPTVPPATLPPLTEGPTASPPAPLPSVPAVVSEPVPVPPAVEAAPEEPQEKPAEKTETDLKIPELPKDSSDWLKDKAPEPASRRNQDKKKPEKKGKEFPSLRNATVPPPKSVVETPELPPLPDLESLPPITPPSLDAEAPLMPPPEKQTQKEMKELPVPETAAAQPELPVLPDIAATPPTPPPLPPANEVASQAEEDDGLFPGLTKTFRKLLTNDKEAPRPVQEEVAPALPEIAAGQEEAPLLPVPEPMPPQADAMPDLPPLPGGAIEEKKQEAVVESKKKPEKSKAEQKETTPPAIEESELKLPDLPPDFAAMENVPPPPLPLSQDFEVVEQNNQPVAQGKQAEKEMALLSSPPAEKPAPALGPGAIQVIYSRDETDIPAALKPRLSNLAKQAKEKKRRLMVTAYASGKKDEAKAANMISLSRALSLRAFLIESGLPQDKIIVKAKGVENPGGNPDRADVVLD